MQRCLLTTELEKRFTASADCLVQSPDIAIAPTKKRKCVAETVLGGGPLERDALAGAFHEGSAVSRDRLLRRGGAALAVAQGCQRATEVVLNSGPLMGAAAAGPFLEAKARPIGRGSTR
jgi:hypothetical protein